VALPVTANFIDPFGWRWSKSPGSPGRIAGYGGLLRLRKGHSVAELTLPAESLGRHLQPVPML
jgi:hypothetical protein